MVTLLEKFVLSIKQDGLINAFLKTKNFFFSNFINKFKTRDPIFERRLMLSTKLNKDLNSTVKYGPFKGFRFCDESGWGDADRASQLLGLYEQEVLSSLMALPKKYRVFINLGAADGYYALGFLKAGLFEKSYCYEISEKGQKNIIETAAINSVSDRVTVRGIANRGFYEEISDGDIEDSVLFVDIEGGEFDILDRRLFEKFKHSVIFLEIHDWLFDDGAEKIKLLQNEALRHFSITELTTGSRDLSKFEELKQMSDTDRWLICSEGRPCLMRWWRLDPL